MNGTSSSFNEARRDAMESPQFWREIWDKEVLHDEKEEWLKELKHGTVVARQEGIAIKAAMVTARSKKIPNWKAPGPDGVDGYCIKNLTALHEQMADHIDNLINNRVRKTKKEVVLLILSTHIQSTTCLKNVRNHS